MCVQEGECTERDGWLVDGYADKIRAIMTRAIEQLLSDQNLETHEEEGERPKPGDTRGGR